MQKLLGRLFLAHYGLPHRQTSACLDAGHELGAGRCEYDDGRTMLEPAHFLAALHSGVLTGPVQRLRLSWN